MAKAKAPAVSTETENFETFLHRVQNAKLNAGLVIVAAAHPDATEAAAYPGAYSGFPLTKGPAFARWSDGSTEGDAPKVAEPDPAE